MKKGSRPIGPDGWINKDRMRERWEEKTLCTEFLKRRE
jgi:hypothetical protein